MTKPPKKVVTLGEVMARLSPPHHQRFAQATSLGFTYGGGEANVCISLAYMGLEACHVTRFPDHMLGRAATQYLRHHGVDTRQVQYGDQKMGIYYLEQGAGHRASEIVYDRAGSAFAQISPALFDWPAILQGADWFHWSGITPGISQGAADTCLEAIQTANEMGIRVSGDVHSRKSLWQYGKSPQEVLPALVAGSDYLLGGAFDFATFVESIEPTDDFSTTGVKLSAHYPRLLGLIDKDRDIRSASHNRIRGKIWCKEQEWYSDWYDIQPIIDRVGTGDAFAAGLIYGLLHLDDQQMIAQYATAACALKHTIPGDANLVAVADILALASGQANGRIKR